VITPADSVPVDDQHPLEVLVQHQCHDVCQVRSLAVLYVPPMFRPIP
jgi:hypothetical protein